MNKQNTTQNQSNETQSDVFCDICIRAIRSRGETIYVGEPVPDDEKRTCAWCEESGDLFTVAFER